MITTTPASAAARVLHRVLSRQRTADGSPPVTVQHSTGVVPATPSAKRLALG